MNNRFKFRVFGLCCNSKLEKEWVNITEVGKFFIDKDGKLIDESAYFDPINHPEHFIVEQCTGMKDKNGKLIYEGDIIHEVDKEADIDDVSQIVWNQDTCHFMRLDLPDTKLNRHCLLCESESPYIEIIGNIHNDTEAD